MGTVRRLITVILVSRSDEEVAPPEVERLEAPDTLGARIGEPSVQFRLNMPDVAVTCRRMREDGTLKWLECSAPSRPSGSDKH